MADPMLREQSSGAGEAQPAANRRVNAVFVGEALVTLALGLVHLGTHSLSGDEGTSAVWTGKTWDFLVDGLRHEDVNMWLYHGFEKLWQAVGDSEAVLRIPSVLAAAASVFVVAKLAARLFGSRTGIVAGLVFATGALLVQHAQNARGYALLVLLTALATYAFVVAIESGGRGPWIAFTALTVLSIYTHLFALLVVLAQVLSIACSNRSVRSLRALWISLAVIGASCLPIAVAMLMNGGGQIDWIPATTARAVRVTLIAIGSGTARTLLLAVFLLVAFVALLRTFRQSGRSTPTWRLALVIAWLVVPPIAALVISATVQHLWMTRYLVIGLAPLAIVAAYGITRITDWRIVAAITVVIVVLGLPTVRKWYHADSENFRGATASVLDRVAPGDGIAFCAAWIRLPFEYYADHRTGLRPDPISPRDDWGTAAHVDGLRSADKIREAFESHRRVWLVTYGENTRNDSTACRLRGGHVLSRRDFGGVVVSLVEPHD